MPPPAAPRAVPASRSGKRASTCRSGKGASTPAPAAAVSADEVGGTDDETETAPLPAPDDATAAPTSPPTPASAPTPAADDEDGDDDTAASAPTPAVANDSVYGGEPPPADVAPATAADDAAANDNNNDALTADALDIGMAYDDLQRRIDRRLKEVAAAIEAKEKKKVRQREEGSDAAAASTKAPAASITSAASSDDALDAVGLAELRRSAEFKMQWAAMQAERPGATDVIADAIAADTGAEECGTLDMYLHQLGLDDYGHREYILSPEERDEFEIEDYYSDVARRRWDKTTAGVRVRLEREEEKARIATVDATTDDTIANAPTVDTTTRKKTGKKAAANARKARKQAAAAVSAAVRKQAAEDAAAAAAAARAAEAAGKRPLEQAAAAAAAASAATTTPDIDAMHGAEDEELLDIGMAFDSFRVTDDGFDADCDFDADAEPETTNGGLASVGCAGVSKGKLTAKEKRAMKDANRKQKRTEANKEKRKGGFVRLESRAEAGAFAGNGGRKRTCLPDAITAALGMLGVVVDKTTVRDAIAPDWKKKNSTDPSVADAEAYLRERHGKVLTPQTLMRSNPHALFSVRVVEQGEFRICWACRLTLLHL